MLSMHYQHLPPGNVPGTYLGPYLTFESSLLYTRCVTPFLSCLISFQMPMHQHNSMMGLMLVCHLLKVSVFHNLLTDEACEGSWQSFDVLYHHLNQARVHQLYLLRIHLCLPGKSWPSEVLWVFADPF